MTDKNFGGRKYPEEYFGKKYFLFFILTMMAPNAKQPKKRFGNIAKNGRTASLGFRNLQKAIQCAAFAKANLIAKGQG